jgi:hypothetical protein
MRREAILGLLAECEAEGAPAVDNAEVAEFRHLVGEDDSAVAA